MIELLLLATIHWHHFQTTITWDAVPATATSEAATHYWVCITNDPEDFTVSLVDTAALCIPVMEGTRFLYFDGFNDRIITGDLRYFSVVACNGAGCSGFRD